MVEARVAAGEGLSDGRQLFGRAGRGRGGRGGGGTKTTHQSRIEKNFYLVVVA